MVEILCPHCEEEIELDDDAKGEFACPYCEGEFEWGVDEGDELDSFMDEIDTGMVASKPAQQIIQPTQQFIQVQANGESNTIAIVAIVFAGIALMGALGGAWLPLFGLCNLLFVIPAVIIAYMSRSKIQHLEGHKDAGMVKAGWIMSLVSLALTILPQIFWLVFIFAFAEAGDVVADGWFDCGNGESVPEMFVNDGEWDCSNGADEN